MAIIRNWSQEEIEGIPRAREYPPHEQRARMDLMRKDGDDPLAITEHERVIGHVRPLWHSYQHIPCGTINSLRFHDAADALAFDPKRIAHRWKGLNCRCDNDMHPIAGDLRGRPAEYYWVDTAGMVTSVLVGE